MATASGLFRFSDLFLRKSQHFKKRNIHVKREVVFAVKFGLSV